MFRDSMGLWATTAMVGNLPCVTREHVEHIPAWCGARASDLRSHKSGYAYFDKIYLASDSESMNMHGEHFVHELFTESFYY